MGYNALELCALFEKVTREGYTPDDEARDEHELAALINEQGWDVVRAAIAYATDGDPNVEIHELRVALNNNYRGAYNTFGEFVRQEERACLESAGAGALRIFDKLAGYVDWDEYSDTPEWSAPYRTVELDSDDAESGATVYVFS